jgi:hypothetical protein
MLFAASAFFKSASGIRMLNKFPMTKNQNPKPVYDLEERGSLFEIDFFINSRKIKMK